MRIVVALGGNAILPRGARGTASEQRAAIREACGSLAALVVEGHSLLVTHGNGPQVGRLVIKDEASAERFPPMPLDVHVAETQGQLGYMIQQELAASLRRARTERSVVTVVTQVVVDAGDPAFVHPTKPVGPHLSEARAATLRRAGIAVERASGGGWRRVVPSPEPRAIVEEEPIRALCERGAVVIAAGGGGIPVVREGNALRGVPAVVDKDLAAAILAQAVGADLLVIATDVEHVQRRHGTPEAEPIARMTPAEARAGVEAGEFPRGSMGEKVLAAAHAAEHAARAVICSLDRIAEGVAGRAGTEVVP